MKSEPKQTKRELHKPREEFIKAWDNYVSTARKEGRRHFADADDSPAFDMVLKFFKVKKSSDLKEEFFQWWNHAACFTEFEKVSADKIYDFMVKKTPAKQIKANEASASIPRQMAFEDIINKCQSPKCRNQVDKSVQKFCDTHGGVWLGVNGSVHE